MPRNTFKPIHGHAPRSGRTPTYRAWESMVGRCTRPTAGGFSYYGGRGIRVCDHWRDFEAFLSDMGERPAGMSLERKNNEGPYAPDNCRWATFKEQMQNRRTTRMIKFRGRTQSLMTWCEELRLVYNTTYYRLRNGWSVEDALTRPRFCGPARAKSA